MTSQFNSAYLFNSTNPILIVNKDRFPQEFDFDNAIGYGKEILSILSYYSGGQLIKDCRITVNREFGYAHVYGDGASAMYTSENYGAMSNSEHFRMIKESTTTLIGSVVTSPEGECYSRVR